MTQGRNRETDRDERAVHRAIADLQRLTDLFGERRRQLARDAGLAEGQWQVLEEIAGEGFMPSLFARRRSCAPASVSRTLRQLLERGLVDVAISAKDARQRVYRLTPAGRRLLRRLGASRGRAIRTIWRRFSRSELNDFSRFATELSRELESYADSHGDSGSQGA